MPNEMDTARDAGRGWREVVVTPAQRRGERWLAKHRPWLQLAGATAAGMAIAAIGGRGD